MDHERIIVAQAPPPPGVRLARLPVGVVLWTDPVPTLTVVVKVTLSFGADAEAAGDAVRAVLAEAQEPLSLNRTAPGAEGQEELVYPTDFVPFKPDTDVLLAGHGYGGGAAPAMFSAGDRDAPPITRITARIAVDEWSRSFQLVASGEAARLPLRPPYVRDPIDAGVLAPPVGPVAAEAILNPRDWHAVDFDYSAYSAVAPAQRVDLVLADATLDLVGLSPRAAARRVILPGLSPRVLVDLVHLDEPLEVEALCDTVWVHTDREIAVLLFRGNTRVTSAAARDVNRVIVALDRDEDPRAPVDIIRALPHGHFHYALTRDDLAPGAPPVPEQSDALTMARRAALAYRHAADPALPIAEFAAISAELGSKATPRAEILRRRGLTEDQWVVEERAWGEAITRADAGAGRALAKELGARIAAARKSPPARGSARGGEEI